MRYMIVILALIFLSSCSLKYADREHGKIWCNDRYLNKLDTPFSDKELAVAERGYIYALAGVLVLQDSQQESKDHYFPTPSRLKLIDNPKRDFSGFEVGTFKLYETEDRENIKEIIIAFTGSNDSADWLWSNLLFSKKQYRLAEKYVLKIIEQYPNSKIVLAGYSLGGGLAVHVAKNPSIKEYISEVWALNPSPKIYASGEEDKKIWLAAVRGEALAKMRKPLFYNWPGVNNIGAPAEQTADDFYLVKSTSIYGHFRWVLARNMLHAADLSIYKRTKAEKTEPLMILKSSSFKSCEEIK